MPIPISQLVSRIALDISDATSGLRQHRQDLQGVQQGYQETGAAAQSFAQRLTGATNESQQAAAGLRTMGTSTQDVGERATQLRAKIIELQSALSGLRGRLKDLEGQNANLGGLLGPNIDQTRTEMARLQGQIASTRGELRDLSKTTDETGSSFQRGVEHVLKYAVAYEALRVAKGLVGDLAQASVGLQTELVKTAALTDVSSKDIGTYGDQISRLSADVGKTGKELGSAFYFIASSGVASADSMKVLTVSAKAAAAGLGETKTVADAVTSTLNAYKLSGDQAGRVTDVLVQAVKEGKGEASEFASSLGRVLPVAAASGVSIEQVAASMAVMTRGGLSAAESATALRGTLSELERPGAAAKKALAEIGLSAESVRASIRDRGLLVTLEDLMQRTGGNIETLGAIIPNIRALIGVLSTAGSQSEEYVKVLDSMNHAQGATEKAFKITSESVEFQSNRVKAALERIGNTALEKSGALKAFGDVLEQGVNPKLAIFADNLQTIIKGLQSIPTPPAWLLNLLTGGTAGLIGGLTGVAGAAAGALGGYIDTNANPKTDQDIEREEAAILAARREARGNREIAAGTTASQSAAAYQASLGTIDYTALRQQQQGLAATSTEARKLHEILLELWKLPGDADPKIIEDKLKSLATAEATQEQAWRRALNPEEAAQRVGRLSALTDELTQAIKNQDAVAQASAQARIDAYLQETGAADTAAQSQRHLEEQQRQAAAKAKAALEEQKRLAKEAREALVDALVGGLESSRTQITEQFGKTGEEALSTFVSGVSGARGGQTESILQAQARLAKQFRDAGVANWQEAAQTVGQAYLDALAGKLSPQQAAASLQAALAEVPRLSLETLSSGFDRTAFLDLGGNAGRSLAEGIENGFREGGKKNIEEVRRGVVDLLRQTEGLSQEQGEARAAEFLEHFAVTIQDGSPEAIAAFEEFAGKWAREVKLDKAAEQMAQKLQNAFVDHLNRTVEIRQQAQGQFQELVRGVGEERGTAGLEVFRQHMRETLGEGSEGFRRVSLEVDVLQKTLGETEGFRKARENFQLYLDGRLNDFKREQDREADVFRDREEANQRVLAHARADQDRLRNISREDSDRMRARSREDMEFNKRLNQDLADATKRGATPKEVSDINERARREREGIADRRRYENEDVAVARQRQAQDLDLQRTREQQDVESAKALRERQHDFERGQQLKLDQFQRQLAVERTTFEDQQADLRAAHQVRQIIATQDKQLHEAEASYEKLRRAEQQHYAQIENDVLRPAFLRQLQLFNELFVQPAHELYAGIVDEQGVLAPYQAAEQRATASAAATTTEGPTDVRLDDESVTRVADAMEARPNIIDAESVEPAFAQSRGNRIRTRSLG